MPTLSADALQELVATIFRAAGADDEKASVVAESLVMTELAGHHSHGVMRVSQYIGNIRDDHLVPTAEPRRVMDEGPIGVVDGGWGFGQVTARAAAEFAAEKAREHGVSCIALRNSNHAGRIGEYTEMIAEEGLAGIAFVTGHGRTGLVAPHGGMTRQLNTNPVAITVPGTEGFPLTFDAATCAAA
ncbi:MAG: Ldh family oxidoreductase, partial [Armatimonadota bacterium]